MKIEILTVIVVLTSLIFLGFNKEIEIENIDDFVEVNIDIKLNK